MESELVLIVDDNVMDVKLVRDLLQFDGFRTIEATSAEDAVALAAVECPQVILLDVLLPDADGPEVLEKLRAVPWLAGTRVVALTAMAMPGDRERLLAAGFCGYLAKPIDVRTFSEQVRQFCPQPPPRPRAAEESRPAGQ